MYQEIQELVLRVLSETPKGFAANLPGFQLIITKILKNNRLQNSKVGIVLQNFKLTDYNNEQHITSKKEEFLELLRSLQFELHANFLLLLESTATDSLIEKSKPRIENFFNEAQKDLIELEKGIKEKYESFTTLESQAKVKIEILNSAEDNLAEFRRKLTVVTEAGNFLNLSKLHYKRAKYFGIAVAFLITAIIVLLGLNLSSHTEIISIIDKGASDLQMKGISKDLINTGLYLSIFKYFMTRIFVLSLLIYITVFCVKNYNAQMHNAVINNQKFHALNSTISLINTAKTKEGNDKIMSTASQAIFSHQNTGYGNIDSEPPNPNLVTNIIDSAGKMK